MVLPASARQRVEHTGRWPDKAVARANTDIFEGYLLHSGLFLLRGVDRCEKVSTRTSFEGASAESRVSAVKTAKRILKQDSNNLLLWDAYARIELSVGNKNMARTVYANALALAQTLEEKFKTDVPLLWKAWVELEWEDGRLDAALAVLVVSSKAQITKETLGTAIDY